MFGWRPHGPKLDNEEYTRRLVIAFSMNMSEKNEVHMFKLQAILLLR